MTVSPLRVAEVSVAAIRKNVERLRSLTGGNLIVVVKADGYGHGAVAAAQAALAGGADMLATADLHEALELRDAGVPSPMLCWMHGPRTDFAPGIAHGIDLAVNNAEQLDRIAAAAAEVAQPATVQLKVDSGLSRNGIPRDQWGPVLRRAAQLHSEGTIRIRGIFSHLANAGEDHDRRQAAAFDEAIDRLRGYGVDPELIHLAASAATLTSPHLHYNTVRVGIAAYGLSPFGDRTSAELQLVPAMTLRSEVVALRDVLPGTGVSYGFTHFCESATTLALVPMGYADGVPRGLSGRSLDVVIAGERCAILGRVSMDQIIVDVGPLAGHIQTGEPVTLFGDPTLGVPAADSWADALDTINYEVVVGIGRRVAREYPDHTVAV